jgi:hypothetical protein
MGNAKNQRVGAADDKSKSKGKGKGVTSPPDDGTVRVGTGGTPPPGNVNPSTGKKRANR